MNLFHKARTSARSMRTALPCEADEVLDLGMYEVRGVRSRDGGQVPRPEQASLNLQVMLLAQIAFGFLEKNRRWCGAIFSRAVPETFAMVDGRMVDGHADGCGRDCAPRTSDCAPQTQRRCHSDVGNAKASGGR
jgi:hypothetical protein